MATFPWCRYVTQINLDGSIKTSECGNRLSKPGTRYCQNHSCGFFRKELNGGTGAHCWNCKHPNATYCVSCTRNKNKERKSNVPNAKKNHNGDVRVTNGKQSGGFVITTSVPINAPKPSPYKDKLLTEPPKPIVTPVEAPKKDEGTPLTIFKRTEPSIEEEEMTPEKWRKTPLVFLKRTENHADKINETFEKAVDKLEETCKVLEQHTGIKCMESEERPKIAFQSFRKPMKSDKMTEEEKEARDWTDYDDETDSDYEANREYFNNNNGYEACQLAIKQLNEAKETEKGLRQAIIDQEKDMIRLKRDLNHEKCKNEYMAISLKRLTDDIPMFGRTRYNN